VTWAYIASRVHQQPAGLCHASTLESLGLAVTFIASKPGDGYRRETVTVDLFAWCIGRPNDRTCSPTKGNRIRIRIFTNEVRILEREKNLKSLVISAYPIRRETCNPAGGGFCRIVEIRPDPDSRIGYPSIPSCLSLNTY